MLTMITEWEDRAMVLLLTAGAPGPARCTSPAVSRAGAAAAAS